MIAEAAALVLVLIDEHEWDAEMVAAQTNLPPLIVRNLERVGRKHLHAELVWGETPGRRHLARLPFPEQERWLNSPVPVATVGGDELRCEVDNLTPQLCRQVFDGRRVRTPAEQRAWLETRAKLLPPVQVNEPYRITGQILVVLEPCKLSCKQLLSLAAQMQ
jgi:hypothetical protein